MKFKEVKSLSSYRPQVDFKCAHCMQSFDEEDDIGKCVLTDHYTHAVCTGHDS
jgi:hypothetical protein